MAINLLPPELIPKGPLIRVAAIARRINAILLVLFLLAGSAILAIFLIDLFTLRASQASQTKLGNEIKSLQRTEQSLVLIKDRIGKVDTILSERGGDVDKFEDLVTRGIVPSVSEAAIESGKIESLSAFPNSISLVAFMSNLLTVTSYKNIVLDSFTFNPLTGYEVRIAFSK